MLRALPALLLVGLLGTATVAQTTWVVTVSGFDFVPDDITIAEGDTVMWTNLQDGQAHNVAQVDCPATPSSVYNGGFWSGFQGDVETFSVTFDSAGDFCYVCQPHASFGMNGSISVEAVAWTTLAGSVAGTNGTPVLAGSGALLGGDLATLSLTDGLPNGAAYLVLGVSLLNAPFKQGILVPSLDILLPNLPLDGTGALAFSFTWPIGLPSGASLWWQYWIPDAGGPAGFAASNGLQSTQP